jgi:DNA-cytosine methyltransferase
VITIGSLFSGIGGLELGLERALGAETIWQVEQEAYCRQVLAKHWPAADRSITDVCEAGAGNLTKPDLICAGFPCQGISVAGLRRGLEDERSKLWWQLYRVLGELRPSIVVLENVPAIVSSGIAGVVVGCLSSIGYDCEWQIISAQQLGAPHIRRRWFCIGYLSDDSRNPLDLESRRSQRQDREDPVFIGWDGKTRHLANADNSRRPQQRLSVSTENTCPATERQGRRQTQSNLGRVADGVSGWLYGNVNPELWEEGIPRTVPDGPARHRVSRLKALGNAVVPACSYEVGLRIREVVCQCTSEG